MSKRSRTLARKRGTPSKIPGNAVTATATPRLQGRMIGPLRLLNLCLLHWDIMCGRRTGGPYAALAQFRAEFYDLVNAGDTKAAVAALANALANGIVPLGAEAEYLRAAAVCARTDMALVPDMLIEIARMFGGGAARFNDPLSEFARESHEKAEAMRWLARVERDSARGDRLFGLWARYARRRTRVARAILDIANTNLLSSDLPELRAEVDNARRYAPWLAGKIVPEPLEAKRAMLESTLRGHEILAIVVAAIMSVLLGLWYLLMSL